jgi:hypothetical protein
MADLKTLLLNQDTQGAEVFGSPKERLNFYRSDPLRVDASGQPH